MKNKVIAFLFLGFIFIFSILSIIIPDKDISKTERRYLKKFPEFEFSSSWITEVDKYFLDHFVLRDKFRGLKATYNYYVMHKLDNNGIYLKDGYIFKSNYPTNEKSIVNFKDKMLKLNSLLSSDNKTYLMIVPDKNYYLKDDNFLQIDYEYLYKTLSDLPFEKIDVRNDLMLDYYYKTDTHWRQEKLSGVVLTMDKKMNFNYNLNEVIYTPVIYDKFYGVYYGESAIVDEAEKLVYLDSDIFDEVAVRSLENENLKTVYNVDKLEGIDSYDVFLDGASAFIEIINDKAVTDRELVIFRDSFGSSLTPLLVNNYKKITLIDNRYISSEYFSKYIEFRDQDVLFLYSTLFINDSGSLKG